MNQDLERSVVCVKKLGWLHMPPLPRLNQSITSWLSLSTPEDKGNPNLFLPQNKEKETTPKSQNKGIMLWNHLFLLMGKSEKTKKMVKVVVEMASLHKAGIYTPFRNEN